MSEQSSSAAIFQASKLTSRIVLIGGGHSHVQFLKNWRMHPLAGVEVILISPDPMTPYSGMLPARLANWVSNSDMHFDLLNLCMQSGVSFLCDRVVRVDVASKKIELQGRPPLVFDVVSLNVGITPALPEGASGHPHVTAVKPIGDILRQWETLWKSEKSPKAPWVVMGGGAAGFELVIICKLLFQRHRYSGEILLLEGSDTILPGHGRGVQKHAMRLLAAAGVKVKLGCEIRKIHEQSLVCSSGEEIAFSEAIVATGAKPAAWLAESGLPVSEQGFVRVDSHLRVEGLDSVFAAGDCAHFSQRPLPKAGVFAVREGPVLIANIRKRVLGQTGLLKYKPQKYFLSLLTSGERRALLSYRGMRLEGGWLWRLKIRIDMKFMKKFGAPAVMPMPGGRNTCGECGGKVTAQEITALVKELQKTPEYKRLLPSHLEDVGVIGDIVSSIDGFRSFTRDDFFFGQVAVWHALNDLFASGVTPSGVTVYVGMPEARSRLRQNRMLQLMSGILKSLSEADVPLLNAHSAEGAEVNVVISAVGAVENKLWSKAGLKAGDSLILTKSLGTGVLLQAQMAGAIPSAAWTHLNATLLQHHARLVELLKAFNIQACTDVSGFGLGGHLCEMLEASQMQARLKLNQLPLLPSFLDLAEKGFASLLASQNLAAFGGLVTGAALESPALWDPQTHGPLLIGARADQVESLQKNLHGAGFTDSRVIGQVIASGNSKVILE